LDDGAREWLRRANVEGAAFLIADEGPGLSGSSFLAVGEALVEIGVPSHRITFLCSRPVDPSTLLAPEAPTRWAVFRTVACPPTSRVPKSAGEYLVGDAWRRLVYDDESEWPASWTQLERLKFLSSDRTRLVKFEGLGAYGAEAMRRAVALFEDGWGPHAVDEGDGFVSYAMAGRPLHRDPGTEFVRVLDRIARYCAARVRLFRRPGGDDDGAELLAMLRTNVLEEFGRDLPATWIPVVEHPVIADARMQPHEWVRSASGSVLKVDGVAHGDDHVFPGWTDVAWDLAGTMVEWGLDPGASDWFLQCYRRASGEDPRGRIGPYLRAYAVFRMAYSKMAAMAVGPGEESERLARDYRRYRAMSSSRGLRLRLSRGPRRPG
jgi:hypothetical protein